MEKVNGVLLEGEDDTNGLMIALAIIWQSSTLN